MKEDSSLSTPPREIYLTYILNHPEKEEKKKKKRGRA
jgi:hypothetical protein